MKFQQDGLYWIQACSPICLTTSASNSNQTKQLLAKNIAHKYNGRHSYFLKNRDVSMMITQNSGDFIEADMLGKIFIEIFFSAGLFINALLFIPQVIKLLRTQNAQGLSIITFGGFNLIQLFTVLHGYLHKDYLLAVGNLLSFIACGAVTFLIVLYKIKGKK